MNVKLKKTFDFSAGLVYNTDFTVNFYTVTITMTTMASDSMQQNVAYERLKYWFDQVMFNSIIMRDNEPKLAEWFATDQRIILLPEQPVDQLLGIVLFSKLNAIVENVFVINELEISSAVGDEVCYIHNENEFVLTEALNNPGWWSDPGPTWVTNLNKRHNNKVIKLRRVPEWKDVELDWNQADSEIANTVLFVDFPRNDKK